MNELQKPLIIPIFIPQAGCFHQCIYCNQSVITGERRFIPSEGEIRSRIRKYLAFGSQKRGIAQIAFFGGNFLGLPEKQVRFLLEIAESFVMSGDIESIRCSTRPDTVNRDTLDWVSPFPVSTIEIGVQSMDDGILDLSQRGHRADDTVNAMKLLKQRNYKTGVQMMVGLPGDTEKTALRSAEKIIALKPDFIRIYPTLVLAGSLLAAEYQKGTYTPMTLSEAVSQVKNIFLRFMAHGTPVIRMGLQPTKEFETGNAVLAGPYHPSFGHLVYSEIFLDSIVPLLQSRKGSSLSIRVHPKRISTARGIRNRNIEILTEIYGLASVTVKADERLGLEELMVGDVTASLWPWQPSSIIRK
jgi:histone acetyltransferase (RNA polymerase elongator complex component)